MKPVNPIESLLETTPLPHVVEGAHRERLKRQLITDAQSAQIGGRKVNKFSDRISIWKAAAILIAAVLLIGAGWAAEKIYDRFFNKVSVILDQSPSEKIELSNGTTLSTTRSVGTVVDANDPKALETAKLHHEEMKRLIEKKEYELVRTFEFAGRTEYVYKFNFSDGSHDSTNFSMPLDKVSSWEDYQQKAAQQEKQRMEQIDKAIAAGRFRLIDMDYRLIHICREVATDKKFQINRVIAPDPRDQGHYSLIAMYFPMEIDRNNLNVPRTSWQEHLDMVRDGKFEILDTDATHNYRYEIILDDGSKTVFSYGGREPLKKP